jgi:TonB family protein
VGSAAEITGGSAETTSSLGGARANPVPLEVPVNATGTRPGSNPEKRELFSEDTETVLVFADGAIIRLSAAVATGQLIFLTHKQTKVEVVCQVVGKRVYRPTNCYVELQFTEPMTGFWGVEFPAVEPGKMIATPSVNGESTESIEAVESAEITEDGAEVHAPMPSDKEVEELREEVELLRKQLQELKQAEDSAKAVAKMAEPVEHAPAPVAATPDPVVPPAIAMSLPRAAEKPVLMDANEPAPTFTAPVTGPPPTPLPTPPVQVAPQTPMAPPPALARTFGLSSDVAEANRNAQKAVEARKPPTPMALPNRVVEKIDPEQEVIDQLLPQPALDFSKAPKFVRSEDPNDPYSIYKPTRAKMGKWTLTALALVLVGAVTIGVWKLGVVQNLMTARQRKAAAAAQSVPTAPAVTAKTVAPVAVAGTNEAKAVETATPGTAGAAAVTPETTAPAAVVSAEQLKEIVKGSAGKTAKAADFHAAGPSPDVTSKVPEKNTAGASRKAAGKKKAAEVAEQKEAPVEPVIPDDAPVEPAKLLKGVNPIYPPDAMRNFITGDVRLKAEIGADGKIGNIEVVSGPADLLPAALDAMKQYVYAPATKGGKGIGSTVKVTIKFWFDP